MTPTATARRIVAPPAPTPPDMIELELDMETAQVLYFILRQIGGPVASPRGRCDAIRQALDAAGVPRFHYGTEKPPTIYFEAPR